MTLDVRLLRRLVNAERANEGSFTRVPRANMPLEIGPLGAPVGALLACIRLVASMRANVPPHVRGVVGRVLADAANEAPHRLGRMHGGRRHRRRRRCRG
jgi:hypothetical protein